MGEDGMILAEVAAVQEEGGGFGGFGGGSFSGGGCWRQLVKHATI